MGPQRAAVAGIPWAFRLALSIGVAWNVLKVASESLPPATAAGATQHASQAAAACWLLRRRTLPLDSPAPSTHRRERWAHMRADRLLQVERLRLRDVQQLDEIDHRQHEHVARGGQVAAEERLRHPGLDPRHARQVRAGHRGETALRAARRGAHSRRRWNVPPGCVLHNITPRAEVPCPVPGSTGLPAKRSVGGVGVCCIEQPRACGVSRLRARLSPPPARLRDPRRRLAVLRHVPLQATHGAASRPRWNVAALVGCAPATFWCGIPANLNFKHHGLCTPLPTTTTTTN
eukprot:354866-Chlamydomonas_euryale.AAC.1